MHLEGWGWDDGWAKAFALAASETGEPGRVTAQDRDRWTVQTETGPVGARIRRSLADAALPSVGDWVVLNPGMTAQDSAFIVSVLPRRSSFSRGGFLTW